MTNSESHEYWMKFAFAEAETALELGETPVGAVIVKDGKKIIGRGGNRVETLKDPTAHAEIIAIGAACDTTGYERLLDTVMYVILEPCAMCAGAIVLARIPTLVFGAKDPERGACGSHYNICRDKSLNHMVEIIPGVMEQACSGILNEFFSYIRKNKRAR
ncbi:tRNA adenosine(34) deaminase TadA [Candidatus Latescibacterota bacterium]